MNVISGVGVGKWGRWGGGNINGLTIKSLIHRSWLDRTEFCVWGGFGENKVERNWKADVYTQLPAEGEAPKSIFWPTLGIKQEPFATSEFSPELTSISASADPTTKLISKILYIAVLRQLLPQQSMRVVRHKGHYRRIEIGRWPITWSPPPIVLFRSRIYWAIIPYARERMRIRLRQHSHSGNERNFITYTA